MKNKIFQSLAILGACLVFLHLATVPVMADNDDIDIECDITVNGISLSRNTNNAPLLSASEVISGNNRRYPIRVCGNLSLLPTLDPADRPIASIELYNYTFDPLQGQDVIQLTLQEGCLVGDYELDLASNSGPVEAVVDIEGMGNIGTGAGGTPICSREYGQFVPQTSSFQDEWNQSIADLCDSVRITPAEPVHNDDLIVGFQIPVLFWGPLVIDPLGRTFQFHYQLFRVIDNEKIEDWASTEPESGMSRREITSPNLQIGNYTARFVLETANNYNDIVLCEKAINVGSPDDPGGMGTNPLSGKYDVCKQAGKDPIIYEKCDSCFLSGGIWTGIGCIPYGGGASGDEIVAEDTIRALLIVGLGIGGVMVVLMSLAGGFLLTTSQGELKRVDEAKALITSAIAGLLFIIFSVTILRFIGVTILQIPGFG